MLESSLALILQSPRTRRAGSLVQLDRYVRTCTVSSTLIRHVRVPISLFVAFR